MTIKPKLGMIVIVKDSDGDQVATIQDIHPLGTRIWINLQSDPYSPMIEVLIRNNGSWKTKTGRKMVELTTQNEYHSFSLDKRAA